MVLDHEPVHAHVRHEVSGAECRAAAALILMNSAEDDGRTTGWYWTRVPDEPQRDDLRAANRWARAVANEQGPFRDADAALAAAARATPTRSAVARRLEQAAALVRAGEIDASAEEIATWLGEEPPIPPDPPARPEEALNEHDLESELFEALRAGDEDWFGPVENEAEVSASKDAT